MYNSSSSSSSSTSSSPVQTMSENTNLINSFIITNGLVSRLSGGLNEPSLQASQCGDKKTQLNSKMMKTSSPAGGTSIVQKKPLRKLNNTNCVVQSDATILKIIPHLFERFVEMVDSNTKDSCQVMMCKTCRFLLKKNTDILLGHLCKQKDIDKFSSVPIINNQLIFRSKPKNRATPIWDVCISRGDIITFSSLSVNAKLFVVFSLCSNLGIRRSH